MVLDTRHVQGLFLVLVTMDYGWIRETFDLTIALQNLIWGATQSFMDMLTGRYGMAKMVITGIVVYTFGLMLMVHTGTPLGLMLSASGLIGLGSSGMSFSAAYDTISRLTPSERRSWVLGVAGTVDDVGQFVTVPTVQGLLSTVGWVAAPMIMTGLMAIFLLLAVPLRGRTSAIATQRTQRSTGSATCEASAHRGLRLLNLGFLTCGLQFAFISVYMPTYLLDRGFAGCHDMVALAFTAAANIVGTYYYGALGGLPQRKYLPSLPYLIRTAAIALFILLPLSPVTLYTFATVMGPLWLGTVLLTNGLPSQVFGVRYIGALFGFVFLSHQIGALLGVWLGGVVYDHLRLYDATWLGVMALGAVTALLCRPIGDR